MKKNIQSVLTFFLVYSVGLHFLSTKGEELVVGDPRHAIPETEKGRATISKEGSIQRVARSGNVEKMRGLLDKGVAINQSDMVELLLAKNADTNKQTQIGNTALMYAVRAGSKNGCFKFIYGTFPYLYNYPFPEQNSKKIVELLLANNADVNKRNNKGDSALRLTIYGARSDLAKVLLANNADWKEIITDSQTFRPILGSVVSDDLNEKKAGRTESCHLDDIIKMILNEITDIDTLNLNSVEKYEVMRAAALVGNKDMVKRLLDKGVDIGKKDKEGNTVLMIATEFGHKEIADMLRKWKKNKLFRFFGIKK